MLRPTALLIGYATIWTAFVALDATWLVLVASDLFKRDVGAILRDKPDLAVALAFYCIYAGGLLALAVWPALEKRSLRNAITKGALVGCTAYATFDLTNLAIIKGWSLKLAFVDMAWGTVVSALAAACGYTAGMRAGARAAAGNPSRSA